LQSVPTELKTIGHAIAVALGTEIEDLADAHIQDASSKKMKSGSKHGKPAFSSYAQSLNQAAKMALAEAQVAHHLFGPGSSNYKTKYQAAHDLADYARGRQTIELLADCLGLSPSPASNWSQPSQKVVAYKKTIHEKGTHLIVLSVAEHILAQGYIGGQPDHCWYLVTTCTDHLDAKSCRASAYIKLEHALAWYGRYRLADVAKRRAIFTADVAAAYGYGVVALCEKHHQKATSAIPNVKTYASSPAVTVVGEDE
jgi:hypothetical protein